MPQTIKGDSLAFRNIDKSASNQLEWAWVRVTVIYLLALTLFTGLGTALLAACADGDAHMSRDLPGHSRIKPPRCPLAESILRWCSSSCDVLTDVRPILCREPMGRYCRIQYWFIVSISSQVTEGICQYTHTADFSVSELSPEFNVRWSKITWAMAQSAR